MKKEPNKAVERSRLLVTDHAYACPAPSNRLAHLGRQAEEMTRALHITKSEGRPYAFTPPPSSEAYALLVLVNASDVTPEEQAAISRAIVTSGARYVAVWGYKCSTWDDSVDFAYLETDPNFQPPDETFVTTTWHENESPGEAFEFLWMCGIIDDGLPKNVCAFFIGKNEEAEANIVKRAKEFGAKDNENGA